MENFKIIEGFDDNYFAGSLGNILSIKKGKNIILKQRFQGRVRAYLSVFLYTNNVKKRYLSHRLIAKAFIPNPDNKPFVNHKNGIKWDNRIENLEWCTASENQKHARLLSGYKGAWYKKVGKNHPSSKTVYQLDLEGNLIKEWESAHQAAKITGFNRGAICNCCRNILNKHKNFKWTYEL